MNVNEFIAALLKAGTTGEEEVQVRYSVGDATLDADVAAIISEATDEDPDESQIVIVLDS